MNPSRLQSGFRLALTACASMALLLPLADSRAASQVPPARPHSADTLPHVGSTGIAWTNNRFTYEANGKRLSEVLQDFAAVQSLPAIVADGVDGVVHGNFDTTPEAFLDAMAKAYGIIWYHDGSALYFYPARAAQSKLFHLKGYSREQVDQLLSSLNLGDPRFPLRYNAHQKTLLAYGPPRHLEVVSQAIESLDTGVQERDATVVRVYPLRYASASDSKEGDNTVPGLVSVLRGIYGGNNASPGEPRSLLGDGTGTGQVISRMQAMRNVYGGTGDGRPVRGTSAPAGDPTNGATGGDPGAPASGTRGGGRTSQGDDDAPSFQADQATNSVIVRGHPQHMTEYGYLIQRLDRRPVLVELEATIIDVNTSSMDALGIDWSFGGRNGGVAVRNSSGPYVMSTLWRDQGSTLLARIEAMEKKGEARIVAKPRVLGVANRPTEMSQKYSASVRVAGNQDAQLYSVQVGTELQVTPQVSEENGVSRLKLSIYIQDGQFESLVVDNVPVVKQTQIRTEAHVIEGESLLIGGISIEAQSTDSRGVPGLSKIPLAGALFRWQAENKTNSERLFLITPKLVRDIDRLPPAPAAPVSSTPAAPTAPAVRAAPAAPPARATHLSSTPAANGGDTPVAAKRVVGHGDLE